MRELPAKILSWLLIFTIVLELVAPVAAVPWWEEGPGYPLAKPGQAHRSSSTASDPRLEKILAPTRPEVQVPQTSQVDPELLPGSGAADPAPSREKDSRSRTASSSADPAHNSSNHSGRPGPRDSGKPRESKKEDCDDEREDREEKKRGERDRDKDRDRGDCKDVDDGKDRPDDCQRRQVQAKLARIILPTEVGSPIHEWTRRTGFNGPLFPVADQSKPQIFTLDYGIVNRKTHSLSNPGTHTIAWDFLSPNPRGNVSQRRSAASIVWTYRSKGRFPSDSQASYQVEAKVYDRVSPSGRLLSLEKGDGHLDSYQVVAGVTAHDIGQWTLVETVDGGKSSTTFAVVDPPNPTAEWSRRVEGKWETILAPFAAYINDEWLSRSKTVYFPTPTRDRIEGQCAANRRTSVEWHWRSKGEGKDWLNRTRFKSFMSVRMVYRTTGRAYSLATYVFDEAYPQGRLYRQETGMGTLANAPLAWGSGLPEYGNIELEERINGVQTELFTLESRRIDASAQSLGRFYVDNGDLAMKVELDFFPETSPLKSGRWILELRDISNGQVVYTDTRQFTNPEKRSHLSFDTNWSGRGLGGVPLPLGSQVRAEVTVKGYTDGEAVLEALPNAASNRRKGLRNVPERQRPHGRKCRHCHPKSGDSDPPGPGGQGPSGGSSGSGNITYNPDGTYGTWPPGYFDVNDVYIDAEGNFQWPSPPGFAPGIGNPGDRWILASADPLLGITHINLLKLVVNTRFLYQTSTYQTKVGERYQEYPIGISNLALTERFERIKIRFLDAITGAEVGGDPSDIYMHNLDGGYSIRLAPWGVPGPDFDRINIGASPEWWFNRSVERVTVVKTPALSGAAIQLLSGASKNVATNFYSVAQSLGASDVQNPAVGQDLNIGDGELQLSETDLVIATAGLPFHVSRHYLARTDQTSFTNSPEQVQLFIGDCYATGDIYHDKADNWVWSFQEDLEMGEFLGGPGGVWKPLRLTHRWADGRQDRFQLDQASGVYRSVRPDVVAEIRQLDSETYELTSKSKVRKRFRLHGEIPGQPPYFFKFLKRSTHCYLVQELDRNNNALNYTWDASGIRLQKVDDGHRTLATFTWADRSTPIQGYISRNPYYFSSLENYNYAGFFQQNSRLRMTNLTSITDLAGRKVTYTYEAPPQDMPYAVLRYLKTVVQPGNRTIEYRYNARTTSYSPGYSYFYNHYLGFPWESDLVQPAWAHDKPILYTALLTVKYERELRSVWVNGVERSTIARHSNDTALVNEIRQPDLGRLTYQNRKNAGLPASVHKLITRPETGASSQTWVFGTDQLKRVVKMTNPKSETTELTFDLANNLTSVLDALGRLSIQEFDDRRNLVSATDGLNQTTRMGYERDNLTVIEDPLGNRQTYQWDASSNLASSTSPEGRTVNLTRNQQGKVTEAQAPDGGTWNFQYDPDGFLIGKTAPQPSDQTQRAHWSYELDLLKRRIKAIGPRQQVSQMSYDERDRLTSFSLPATSGEGLQTGRPEATTTTEYNVDDLPTRVIDPIGRTTEYVYDQFLRLVRVDHLSAGTSESVSYDGFNNVLTSTNENGDTTNYDFDDNNRVTAVHYPGAAGPESYVYNSAGDMIRMIKTDGVPVNYEFDAAGRLRKIEGKGKQIGYVYDAANRLTAMNDSLGQTVYGYTPDSNLEFLQKPDGKTLHFEFDIASRVRRMVDPEGEETQYGWNELGQLKRLQFGGALAFYDYDVSGNQVSAFFGNGMQLTSVYDERNQLLKKDYSHSNSGSLLTLQYSHDNLGRREAFRRTDSQGVQTRTYRYRAHGELIQSEISTIGEGPNDTFDYSFDNNYNRTSDGFNVNSADQLLGGNGFSQIHENAGSVATLVRPSKRTQFTYDFRDQLLSVDDPDHTITYDYDGDNIRTRKTVDGEITNYLTLGGQVLREYNQFGNPGNAYLPGVAWRRNNDQGDWNYYLTDGLGSVLAVVNNNGDTVARYDYSDYGVLLSSDGPLAEENVFRYTGEQFDPETGFYYLRNRYYQPEFGRFLQRDPIRYAAGPNMYAYCGGDPINFTDPTGLEQEEPEYDPLELLRQFRDRMKKVPGELGEQFLYMFHVGSYATPAGAIENHVIDTMSNDGGSSMPPLSPSLKGAAKKELRKQAKKEAKSQAARVIQTGGNTIANGAVTELNKLVSRPRNRRDWGRALEGLKKDVGLKNGHHQKILSNGDYVDQNGQIRGNLLEYLP